MRRAWNFVDLAGKRYGRLVAISFTKRPEKPKVVYWKCKCDCGKMCVVYRGHLLNGHTQSCGCYDIEKISERFTKHGQTKLNRSGISTPEYSSWLNMRKRCLCETDDWYPEYGGRGITICERWMDFNNFLADMGKKPKGFSIERKNNNGNYEPGNCIWANQETQANNRRGNRKYNHNGKTLTIAQWAREIGMNGGTLYTRIVKMKLPFIEAITRPIQNARNL